MDLGLIKKIITEKKTTLPSFRKKARSTPKSKQFIYKYPNLCNISELNKLIYAGVKLVCDKIGIPLRNLL